MRAFRLASFGAEPALAEVALPDPGPGEVRLRIVAAGVNFADLLMTEGKYQDRPPVPLTLGMEAAGVVEDIGPGVTSLRPGARVAVVASSGAFAEYGCFPAARCIPIPDRMPFTEAAAFPIAYGTSHMALAQRARLGPGETLLVLGAAGGVGLTAVEVGKRLGARVIASARGAERLEIARAAGADELIDSEAPDLKERLRALGGVDVAYDPVGGAGFDAALRAMKPEGRMLAIGFASGEVPQVPANILLVKNLSVIGFWFGGYLSFAPDRVSESLATLFGWYAGGGLRPHVSHVLPLGDAARALGLLRGRQATGKVVLTTGAPDRAA